VEACRNRDMGMIDLLIKYSARDDDCKALSIALRSDDEIIASKLLTLKAHQVRAEFRTMTLRLKHKFNNLNRVPIFFSSKKINMT
jgi:hypothetical protein